MSTGLGLLIIVGLLLALEAWALVNHKPKDTISETIWRLTRQVWLVFLAGFLAGHFFWQADGTRDVWQNGRDCTPPDAAASATPAVSRSTP